jgi:hypothetical protein
MGITNIFRNVYEQPENKLTYAFLSLLEHIDPACVGEILSQIGYTTHNPETVEVELLYGGGRSNPDGSVTVTDQSGQKHLILLENKTWRRRLDMDQIARHLNEHVNGERRRLLVITADRHDREMLEKFNNVLFTTWHELVGHLEGLAKTLRNPIDCFILGQFVEYVLTSREAWRAHMLSAELINKFAQRQSFRRYEEEFVREAWLLMDELREGITKTFNQEIENATVATHWGRLGVECTLRKRPVEQWVFFGVYLSEHDHGIPLTKPFQPEFAIFFDLDPRHRERISTLQEAVHAIEELRNQGFEFNFPEATWNKRRICYWRSPVLQHAGAEVSDLQQMFEERLRSLFQSRFYVALADCAPQVYGR